MGDSWFFDRFAPVYDRVMPPADRDAIVSGFEKGDVEVATVLDLAGGSGRIARELASTYEVTVCDLSRPMLEQARRHGLHGMQADATLLPVRDDTVDGVVIADAYHHLPDPWAVLHEVRRVLRPGGVLVVRDFNPATVRGKAIELVERALRWPCEFRTPRALAVDLVDARFEPVILDGGFDYTVAGVRRESTT